MSRLPRQDVPVSLQRYQPGHLPKRRERTVVGRSNRLEHLAETHRAMEMSFVSSAHRRAHITVGQNYTLSGYRSGQGQVAEAQATRSLASTHREGGTIAAAASSTTPDAPAGNTQDVNRRTTDIRKCHFQPPISVPPTPAETHLATEKAWIELEMHPAVAAMLCDNNYGTGHTITPENFFIRSGGQDADYYTTPPAHETQNLSKPTPAPFARNRHVPVRGEGGGTLEYADPVLHEYARNPVMARFDNRQSKAAMHTPKTETPLSDLAAAPRAVASQPASVDHGSTSGTLPKQDAWLSSYVASARPYDVEPFLGRCGYSDLRLTYHRVQAQPDSDMYAATRDYASTHTVPLETPNQWQLRDARRNKYAPSA